MKKALFLLVFSIVPLFAFCQVETVTSNQCYIFSEYSKRGFKQKKKVKINTPITLLGAFSSAPGYYEIIYDGKNAYIAGTNISTDGLMALDKIKKDKLAREQFVKDSIHDAKMEVERIAIYKARAKRDSIEAHEKHLKDSIETHKKHLLDSLEYDMLLKKQVYLLVLQQKEDSLFKAGFPIQLVYCDTGKPNSAGGCDLGIGFKNISKGTIKYISVTGHVVNAVNDKAYCTIRKYSSTTVRGVGPIEFGESGSYNWENLWYNHTIDSFIPTQIKIEYMDGKVSMMNQNKIKAAINLPFYEGLVKKLLEYTDEDYNKNVRSIKEIGLPSKSIRRR